WFSLCKSTSGMCLILPATHILSHYKDLNTLSLSESRFKEVVRLETHRTYCFSCRLGSFMFSPRYTYACYLVFKYEDDQALSNDACFYKARCNLGDNYMIQGTVFAHLTSVNIPVLVPKRGIGSPESSKSIHMPNKDMDLEHSFVEERNDGWMEVRLTKPLHQLKNHKSLDVNLVEPSSSGMGIIVEGMEFRPVVHDGSYIMAERSANRNIIGTTHLHGTKDHDKNEENTDEYWEKKLPHNHPLLIRMSDIPLKYNNKKELYLLLCRGFLSNDGQLWLSTCKSTRGIFSIQPSTHVLSKDPSYNNLETLSLPESRFKEVKKLGTDGFYLFICRLESFMFSSPDHYKYYACYLVFKIEDGHVLSNDGPIFKAEYRWDGSDNTITATLKPKEINGSSKRWLTKQLLKRGIPARNWVEKRDDGWLEARLTGPLLKHDLEILEKLKVKLHRIKDGSLLGIIVEGVEFRLVV
ncbi:serine-threonine/tyrosine-protein kinase catalytic domain-containing protein, partial [Tanacetum coccineum]